MMVQCDSTSGVYRLQQSLWLRGEVVWLPLNFILEYVIRKLKDSQKGLELSGTHHHPGCVDDSNDVGL
jgi:hypothetical protein